MAEIQALDKLDRAILRCLQDNGRETYDVIGERVGLSGSAVLRRVKRLEDAGVIDRYVALVQPEAVGLGLTAYLNVRLEKNTESHKRNPMTCSGRRSRPGPKWWSAPRSRARWTSCCGSSCRTWRTTAASSWKRC
jgi:DNA-binding Lrp family transcriptional regulator